MAKEKPRMRLMNEPVLTTASLGGLAVAAATFFTNWGNGQRWPLALGAAISELAVVLFAGGIGRAIAWGPKSVDELLDASAVIQEAGKEAWDKLNRPPTEQ